MARKGLAINTLIIWHREKGQFRHSDPLKTHLYSNSVTAYYLSVLGTAEYSSGYSQLYIIMGLTAFYNTFYVNCRRSGFKDLWSVTCVRMAPRLK
jgi:hypothetical protein